MLYQIFHDQPYKHIVDICLSLDNVNEDFIYLNLPAWRPGRYEIANFAKNIYKINAENSKGEALSIEKVSKDRWRVATSEVKSIKVNYQYYANQPDAGGSVADENQLYLNFVNCLLYAEDRMDEPCEVQLSLPKDYTIACGLEQRSAQCLFADHYYHLVDSPMIASPGLQHLEYTVARHNFHIWINGDWQPDPEKLIPAFRAFTEVQIATMGNFPCKDYHFLFQILPYKFYHGVEHFNATVIALGPSEDMEGEESMESLLGVSSHELFHTWNIIRIRPKEMSPYVFDKENYFKTGYVAEGFTTYYGDVFLLRSKVFSKATYFENLNKSLQRHLDNFGRFNLSLADSSYDLWLDGYSNSTPGRKVSIYIKGSLVAFMLDLTIRKLSAHQNSLDDLMRRLWQNFGKRNIGYTDMDIQAIAEELAGSSLEGFFRNYIYGIKPLEEELDLLLKHIGYGLEEKANESSAESLFGFRTVQKDQQTLISTIAPGSVAENKLSKDDELVAVNGRKISNNLDNLIKGKRQLTLSLFRNNHLLQVNLRHENTLFYKKLAIVQLEEVSEQEKANFKAWSDQDW